MSKSSHPQRLDSAIFVCVVGVMVFLLLLLCSNLIIQYSNYRDGIRSSLATAGHVDHASLLTYSRAWDFAVAKTSALFLSFLLIFLGSLYVLRSAESTFDLKAESGGATGSFRTSSPGLVMIMLGVFLVAFVVANKSTIDYRSSPPSEVQSKQAVDAPSSTSLKQLNKEAAK